MRENYGVNRLQGTCLPVGRQAGSMLLARPISNFNMTQKLAWVFGVVLTLVGVLGFVPSITASGMLLGVFQVDTMHNVVHLLSGIVAIGAAVGSAMYSQWYFRIFGIVYALVAVLGLAMGGSVLGMMMNMSDHLLHVVIAAAALWIGFGMKESSSAPMPMAAPSPSSGM